MYRKIQIALALILVTVMAFMAQIQVYADTAHVPVTLTKKAEKTNSNNETPDTADEIDLIGLSAVVVTSVIGGYIVAGKCKKP